MGNIADYNFWGDKMDKTTFMVTDIDRSDGATVKGITLVVDGSTKLILDFILDQNRNFKNHVEIVNDALMKGLKILTDEIKGNESKKNEE